jgi:DNA polymerase-3 subunit epsilon
MARRPRPGRFAAIDFETADRGRDSACALAVVVAEGCEIVVQRRYLIRPPRREFLFTFLHGITWADVADQPPFAAVWAEAEKLLDGIEFLAAHNAPFDRGVLAECCAAGGLPVPGFGFVCTVRLARRAWNLHPARLPDVCRHLGIPLRHHDPLSDATACARIVLAAREQGHPLGPGVG